MANSKPVIYSDFSDSPNFLKEFKCKSIGLLPISHPPGYVKLTFPISFLFFGVKKIIKQQPFMIAYIKPKNLLRHNSKKYPQE